MDEILVIDIGGTKTNVSFVTSSDLKIKVLSSSTFSTCSNPDLEIQKISSLYSEKSKKISSMSLSLPGLWDKNGVLLESFNLKTWIGYPFIKNLSNALNIKDYTWETDVVCGALGEYHAQSGTCPTKGEARSPRFAGEAGQGQHSMSLLYLNLGTGIGAAFIKDGKPFKSNSKLTLRMQKLLFSDQDELVSAIDLISGSSILKGTPYNSVEQLFTDYKAGKIESFEIVSKSQIQLASWLINLFYLFAPDIMILNGGLTYDWEVLCEEAIDIANEELKDQVKILPSKLKDMAPVYGAYLNHKTAVSCKP